MQTVSVDQLVGNTLGDYRVERLLGRGKLSAVYMAQQRSLNRTVMVTQTTATLYPRTSLGYGEADSSRPRPCA